MDVARLASIAGDAEIERADMLLERVGRREHRIAAEIDGQGVGHPGSLL